MTGHPDEERQRTAERRAALADAGRPAAVERRHAAGRWTAREQVGALVDSGSWSEYGAFAVAAQRSRRSLDDLAARSPADGVLTGTGRVDGRPVGVIAYDYTVLAGTQGLTGHRKTDRLLEIAARDDLPVVLFAEGGGGRPSDTDHPTVAGLELMTFTRFAGLRALRVGIAGGYCFAGNAALFGSCDVTLGVTGASIGMGGPAMIEGAGLGTVEPGDVGPLSIHVASGVVDVEVPDDRAAVDTARRLVGYACGVPGDGAAADQSALRAVLPASRRRAYDVHAVLGLLLDRDSLVELQPRRGRAMVTGLARLSGRPVGVMANNPLHGAGALDAAAAGKAARLLRLCDRVGLPVLSLCDTPGIMVGPAAEQSGLVRVIGDLFAAGAALRPRQVTVVIRKAYGLGAMAMAGGSFHASRLTLAWPTAEIGAMGLEGAVRLAHRRDLEAIEDDGARRAEYERLVASAYERGAALSAAAGFELDDVIDPAETRARVTGALFT